MGAKTETYAYFAIAKADLSSLTILSMLLSASVYGFGLLAFNPYAFACSFLASSAMIYFTSARVAMPALTFSKTYPSSV